MPKPRTLDESFWDDTDIALLTRDERLLLIGMVTLLADDEGRLIAEPSYLRKRIFGYDDALTKQEVEAWRDNIVLNCRNVHFYVVGGQSYIWLPNFAEYQNIRYIVASKLPAFAEDCELTPQIAENCGNVQEVSEMSRRVGLSSVGLGSDGLRTQAAQKIETMTTPAAQPPPGYANMPPEVRESMALQAYLIEAATSLMSRGSLTKAHASTVKTWFTKNKIGLTREKIAHAVEQSSRYTGGDALEYLFRVLENDIAGRKRGANGSTPREDMDGPTPPPGRSWSKDENGKWKPLGRDPVTGILPWGGTDITDDDVKEKLMWRAYNESQRPVLPNGGSPQRGLSA